MPVVLAVAVAGMGAVPLRGTPAVGIGVAPRLDRVSQVSADFTLRLRPEAGARVSFAAPDAGPATLLLLGLQHGGAVTIAVNGVRPAGVELLSRGGVALGRADSALVTASLQAGRNEVEVREGEGVQVVRVAGTNCWFGAATTAGPGALFTVDLDEMPWLTKEYPVKVNYGPQGGGFLWFSAKWDRYYGEVYAKSVSRVRGSSGPVSATLSYIIEYPPRNLVMPTQLTLIPEPVTGALTVRVHQAVRALAPAILEDGTEFLHVKITDEGARDWLDGATDYAWYRSQVADCTDAAPGSRTGMVRMDDNTFRVYAYPSSTTDPGQVSISNTHHTGAGTALGATNTIGGYFTKTGVGSCGWVFHCYRSNVRGDVTPVFSHCGDGADTHFYCAAGDIYGPLALGPGDVLETEYSLTMLRSEVTREEIEDLNEADLHFFGTEKEQRAPIEGWIGTRSAVGLRRGDGSVILLGLGHAPARIPVPAVTASRAVNAYRLFCLGELTYELLDVRDGCVEVSPGWVTILDCGAALWEPVPAAGPDGDVADPAASEEAAAVEGDPGEGPWPPPRGTVLGCTLRRK